jgi:hypothetical protein
MNPVSEAGDHCAAGHWCVPDHADAKSYTPTVTSVAISAEEPVVFETEALADSGHPAIWLEWHQRRVAKFDAPEFYGPGPVVSVYCADNAEAIEITGEEESYWKNEFTGLCLRGPEEFRKQFPDGKLPDLSNDESGWCAIQCMYFSLDHSSFSSPEALVLGWGEAAFFSLTRALGGAITVWLDLYFQGPEH